MDLDPPKWEEDPWEWVTRGQRYIPVVEWSWWIWRKRFWAHRQYLVHAVLSRVPHPYTEQCILLEGPVTGAFWAHYPHFPPGQAQKTLRERLQGQKTPLHKVVCSAEGCVHERFGGGLGWWEWPKDEQWWERFCCPGHYRLQRVRVLVDVFPAMLDYDSS